jgi:hypothetical protein
MSIKASYVRPERRTGNKQDHPVRIVNTTGRALLTLSEARDLSFQLGVALLAADREDKG